MRRTTLVAVVLIGIGALTGGAATLWAHQPAHTVPGTRPPP